MQLPLLGRKVMVVGGYRVYDNGWMLDTTKLQRKRIERAEEEEKKKVRQSSQEQRRKDM